MEKTEPEPIDISEILSYKEFQEIKQFILNKGLTKTYCNMYNDNPYYEFGEGIELYLNPIVQFPKEEDMKKPDTYKTIVIVIWSKKENYPYGYTDLVEDTNTGKVYLSPYWDTEESMKYKESKLGGCIENILKEIRQLGQAH
jgi:hypothetical protein